MKGLFTALAVVAAPTGCGGDVGSSTDAPGGSTDVPGSTGGDGGTGGDGARADVPGGVGEPANLAGITLYHNEVRAAVDTTGIAAGPLPPMKWDANLAAYAAAWAAMCRDVDAPSGLI